MSSVNPEQSSLSNPNTYHCVTIFKVARRCFNTKDPEEAKRQAIAAEQRGEFESRRNGWKYLHPHVVFAVPVAEENSFIAETLAALRRAIPALEDPPRIAAERLLLAREITAVAMRLIREETAKANDARVIRAAETAFNVGKVMARSAVNDGAADDGKMQQ